MGLVVYLGLTVQQDSPKCFSSKVKVIKLTLLLRRDRVVAEVDGDTLGLGAPHGIVALINRPERAEARGAGRSLRNVQLSLTALRELAVALGPESPKTQATLDRAIKLASALDDPTFAKVADPQGWLKVQIIQQAVFAARDAATTEIGPALQVGIGFNAADGD